jgi:hypothetical protein
MGALADVIKQQRSALDRENSRSAPAKVANPANPASNFSTFSNFSISTGKNLSPAPVSIEPVPDGRALVRAALADFDRRLANMPRRNEEARRAGSTDRWCERCGDYASNAWPAENGRERWLCTACAPTAGEA